MKSFGLDPGSFSLSRVKLFGGKAVMDQIFFMVYQTLDILSEWTGLSYNEINIIVYYVLTRFVKGKIAEEWLSSELMGELLLKSLGK
ncbi:hypothetical protein P0Y35_11595 [Kiritimatiellaeota bacterium B1221]|nr:hypothetical protein [Kiritimatiellaeota bacterium B1221]